MLRRLLTLVSLALFGLPAYSAEKTGFVKRVYKNADGHDSPYELFVPHGYDGTKPYPVLLFLHGAGETKGGSNQPVEVGLGPAIKKREKTFPFITIIPQAETRGWGAASENGKRALAMLDDVMKEFKTDSKRIYLTGLSMGGMGTMSMAIAHPEKWAAIVPVCGRGDVKQAEKIKDIPSWFFHGDKDTSVNVSGSRDMVAAIKQAGGDPKYTEYPGVPHNSWDKAYGTDELYEWLLKQSKK